MAAPPGRTAPRTEVFGRPRCTGTCPPSQYSTGTWESTLVSWGQKWRVGSLSDPFRPPRPSPTVTGGWSSKNRVWRRLVGRDRRRPTEASRPTITCGGTHGLSVRTPPPPVVRSHGSSPLGVLTLVLGPLRVESVVVLTLLRSGSLSQGYGRSPKQSPSPTSSTKIMKTIRRNETTEGSDSSHGARELTYQEGQIDTTTRDGT